MKTVSLLAAYLLLKYRGRKRRKYLKHQHDTPILPRKKPVSTDLPLVPSVVNLTGQEKSDKIIAVEWLHQYQRRPVKVKFGWATSSSSSITPDGKIYVESRKGDRLRTIHTASVSAMLLEVTEDPKEEPMALLRIHKEHDLVLVFDTLPLRKRFVNVLTQFLSSHGKVSSNSSKQIFLVENQYETRETINRIEMNLYKPNFSSFGFI